MNRLFALYVVISGFALAGPHRPSSWPLILGAHLAVAALALALDAKAAAAEGRVAWLYVFYPLLVMPLLYAELPLLNQAMHGGVYFDETIIGWERALFGGEPARELAAAAPSPWLSEPLHAAYLSYYPIIYLPPILIALRYGRDAARDAVFTLSLVFFAHYLFFVYFPVEGPRYRFPAPAGPIAEWPAYRLAHALLEAGSSRGSAFPSSHIGVSIAATVVCWRRLRPIAPVVGLLTLGLGIGAVYGGFHYAIDMIAGLLLGFTLAAAAPALQRRLHPAESSAS